MSKVAFFPRANVSRSVFIACLFLVSRFVPRVPPMALPYLLDFYYHGIWNAMASTKKVKTLTHTQGKGVRFSSLFDSAVCFPIGTGNDCKKANPKMQFFASVLPSPPSPKVIKCRSTDESHKSCFKCEAGFQVPEIIHARPLSSSASIFPRIPQIIKLSARELKGWEDCHKPSRLKWVLKRRDSDARSRRSFTAPRATNRLFINSSLMIQPANLFIN